MMSIGKRGLHPDGPHESQSPLIMHFPSDESLSSNISYTDGSVFSESFCSGSEYSPYPLQSCPPSPPMPVQYRDEISIDISTRLVPQAMVYGSSSYDGHLSWTSEQNATVTATSVTPTSPVPPIQQQAHHIQASSIPLYDFDNYQIATMDNSALVPDPQNNIHKDHYEFEFTKKEGSFFRLKEECCAEHPASWPETIPVVPYEDPKTGKVRQVCYSDDCPSSFKRPYDLLRHFNTVHGKVAIPCDYKKCGSGIEKAFNRLDHARDHYREYHKEDLVKRCKKDETKAEKIQKWRERQPQRDGRIGLWWRCSACLKRNPWSKDMRKEEAWRCEEKDCHKECEMERKIWRLEGVEAVLVYLKLIPARSAPADRAHGTHVPKTLRRTRKTMEKKVKAETAPSSSSPPSLPLPISLLPQNLSSASSRTSLKRSGSEESYHPEKRKTLRRVAAIDNLRFMAAAAEPATEDLPSYYHTMTFDDIVPEPLSEMAYVTAPASSSPLMDTTSLPEIAVSSCTATIHPGNKGCDSCLSGWRLDGRVTACVDCNEHGCICDTSSRASSQHSPPLASPSEVSPIPFTDDRLPKRQRTGDPRPATPVKAQPLSSPSYEAWNASSPVHLATPNLPTLPVINTPIAASPPSQHTWHASPPHHDAQHNGSPVHPSLLTLRNKTPSDIQSSEKHVSPELHAASWNSSSPLREEVLGEGFGGEMGGEMEMEEGMLIASQFNDEWDAIHYQSSSS